MNITAIVVMNQDGKLDTVENPLISIPEVQDFISSHTANRTVFIEEKQLATRLPQCADAVKTFVVSDSVKLTVPGMDVYQPKGLEMYIKHSVKEDKPAELVVFGSPAMLNVLGKYFTQVIIVRLTDTSQETDIVPEDFLATLRSNVAQERMSLTKWKPVPKEDTPVDIRHTVLIYSR